MGDIEVLHRKLRNLGLAKIARLQKEKVEFEKILEKSKEGKR
jgi:hypothetical protein